MKIAIKTLGCKANRFESDKIEDKLKLLGFQIVNTTEIADFYIINTCTITHVADKKSRQIIRQFRRKNNNAQIVVIGCGTKDKNNTYNELSEINHIFTKSSELISFFKKITPTKKGSNKTFQSRTRALVKIQDGCNNFCSYCIVPFVRGREKFYSETEILKCVREKISRGYKEIVITGIIVGNWKREGKDFADLLHRILKEPGLERLRLSSLEPENFNDRFLDLFNNSKFCKHLHICLQSGSHNVLKQMKRRYNISAFKKICKKLQKKVPNIALTTDVIVGFPGETEKDFKETLKVCKEIGFAKIHAFKYSIRKGTIAATMQNQIPYETKLKRSKELIKIGNQLRKKFIENHLDKELEVLFEQKNKDFYTGLTSNYIQVKVKSKKNLINQILTVQPEKTNNDLSVTASLKS